jgi:hypothetical protein
LRTHPDAYKALPAAEERPAAKKARTEAGDQMGRCHYSGDHCSFGFIKDIVAVLKTLFIRYKKDWDTEYSSPSSGWRRSVDVALERIVLNQWKYLPPDVTDRIPLFFVLLTLKKKIRQEQEYALASDAADALRSASSSIYLRRLPRQLEYLHSKQHGCSRCCSLVRKSNE